MTYDELIKDLRFCVEEGSCRKCRFDNDMNCSDTLMAKAADAIDELSHIQIAPEKIIQTMWIPVTERLPEINQKVLVFSFYTMHVYKFCALDEKCGAAEDHWQDDYGIAHGIEEVQFWMPLPQPPESEGE